MKVSKDQHLKAERKCLSAAAADWSVTRDQTPGTIWGYQTSTFFLKSSPTCTAKEKHGVRESSAKEKFFGEDDVFQMKEFRTTLIYIYIYIYWVFMFFYPQESKNPRKRSKYHLNGGFGGPNLLEGETCQPPRPWEPNQPTCRCQAVPERSSVTLQMELLGFAEAFVLGGVSLDVPVAGSGWINGDRINGL